MIPFKRKHCDLYAASFSEWLAIRWPKLEAYKFQQEIIDLIDNYDGGVLPIFIVGAAGGGKTTLMNEFILYSFMCFNNVRVRFISQTEKQSTGNSFDSIKKIVLDLCDQDGSFKKTLNITDLRITHNGSNSFIETRNVTNTPGKEGSLKGFHAVKGGVSVQIVDECDSMPEVVWNALASNVTNDDGIIVCMSNGGDINSFAYSIWSNFNDKFWKKIHFTAHDIPTFNWAVANSRRLSEGGEAWYSRYVLAEFVASTDNVLFPQWLIDKGRSAVPVEMEPPQVVVGVDIGGCAMSKESALASTAIAVRAGKRILALEIVRDDRLVAIVSRIKEVLERLDANVSTTDVLVDSIGSGMNYTCQMMRSSGLRITPFYATGSAKLTDSKNMRTEVYKLFRQWLMNGGSLESVPENVIDQMRYIEFLSTREGGQTTLKRKRAYLKGLEQAGLDMLDALTFTFASKDGGVPVMDTYHGFKRKKRKTYDYKF